VIYKGKLEVKSVIIQGKKEEYIKE